MAETKAGVLLGAPSGRIRIQVNRRTSRTPQPPLDLRTPSGKRTLPY